MSIKVMTWVWEVSPYTGAGLLMHLALADWSNDEGVCWPTQEQVKHKIRGSVENVRRLTRKMEADGWLEIVEVSTGKGSAHTYRLALEVPVKTQETLPDTGTPTDCGPTPVSPTTGSSYPHISSSFPPHLVPDNRHQPSEVQPSRTDVAVNAPLANLIPADIQTAMFNAFWDIYPRHTGGKPGARRAWNRAIKVAAPTVIADAALRFREDPNRLDEFTPHPTTWLNQHRWEDDPLPARGGAASGTRLYMDVADLVYPPMREIGT